MRRQTVLLVGAAYVLLMAGLIAAAWSYPRWAPPPVAVTQGVDLAAVPTLSRIWPPPETGPAEATRTPRPSPTLTGYYLQTWTPEPTSAPGASPEQGSAGAGEAGAGAGNGAGETGAGAGETGAGEIGSDAGGAFPQATPGGPSITPTGTGSYQTPTPTSYVMVALTPSPTSALIPGSSVTPVPPGSSQVTGRVLLDGTPVSPGLALKLQRVPAATPVAGATSPVPAPVADAVTSAGGAYTFAVAPDPSAAYRVAFSQDWNTSYQRDSIATWAWLGDVSLGQGAQVQLPDLEVSLLGMRLLDPVYEAVITATLVSPTAPLGFEWSDYPEATAYWLDVASGPGLQPTWQSRLLDATSELWPGQTSAGAAAGPGEYWWGVGAQRPLSTYTLTVYSYLTKFVIRP